MKAGMMSLACVLVALVCWPQPATGSHENWIGVWQAKAENQPGITLTLADDAGDLGGTVVFEVWNREENRLIAHEPHTLMRVRLDGNVLSFEVTACYNRSGILKMTVELTKNGVAQFRCSNCGSEAVTELEKTE